jgi:glyoxylase-like metal-dependent hydrolase (beta-lactamase superfamily II)
MVGEDQMEECIKTIRLPLPYRMGRVNCYLIDTGSGFVLIDSGGTNQRGELEEELERVGCRSGNLSLILITHGDFDHTGNAAYLRERYAARVAMHPDDAGMGENADMFYNRSKGNALLRVLVPVLFGFHEADRFSPDILIQDGFDLSEFGFSATVVGIPGHSKGSIGILTASGDLFCGDLLTNTDRPALNSIMDDRVAAHASLEKLNRLAIQTVYPGHGNPFRLDEINAGKDGAPVAGDHGAE